MREKILNILKETPTLSNREIGKIVGLSRGAIQYYMRILNIHRDRKTQQKLNNTCREKLIEITDNAEQLILGSVLGDGYIVPNRHPEDTHLTLNSTIVISHGIKQKEYIEYEKQLFEKEGIKCYLNFKDGKTIPPHYIKGNLIKENGTYILKTRRNVAFNFYRNLFYKPNKTLNRYIYKLKPLGLAIWFMDDGCKQGNGFCLCTNCFTFKEVKLLKEILKHNFNIESTIEKSSLGQPVLYIRTSSRETFINLISPYICESMKYKIGIKSRESGKTI